jgi:hypothetical protein
MAKERILASVLNDGQSLPLEEIETRMIIENVAGKISPEVLRCLMHQAMICDDLATSSEWFKICLDHSLLQGGDEALAARIINSWLTRLQPAKNNLGNKDSLTSRDSKIEEISAELIAILQEIDPARAEEISDQLGTAGFIQPADPVPAIAGAVLAGNPNAAKGIFTRTIAAMPGSRSDLVNRLFLSIEQLEPRPGHKKPDKSGITDLLLDWFSESAGVEGIPVTLALLVARHMEDRARARKIVEDVHGRLQGTGNDDPRLWIPLYMLLLESGTPAEVSAYMQQILPKLRLDPNVLTEYPFTVESLEAEQAQRNSNTTEPVPQMPELDGLDLSIDTPVAPQIHEDALTIGDLEIPPPEPVMETPIQVSIEAIAAESKPVEPLAIESPPEPAREIITELAPEMTAETFVETILPHAVESVVEPVSEPVTELVTETVIEQVTEEVTEPVAAPTTQQITVPEPNEFDWRSAVRNRKLVPGITQKILESPMRNKIEKHLALQTVAVMRGEATALDRWDWRVWRKPNEYGYSRQGRERFPPGLSPRIMKTPAFKLLLRASPFLALSFPERFTVTGLAKSLGLTLKQLQAKRERIDWATGFPGHAGFNYHAKLFTDRGLQLFSLAGLGPQIFYDATSKSVYIDDAYFVRKPPTHLYHRVMFLLYSLRTQFHPLLQLNPEKQILPELNKLKTVIDGGALSILAARAKISDSRMAKLMKSQDFEEFKILFGKSETITSDDIIDANKAMQQYVWRLLLADSLDLTGIVEAMLDIDLMLPGTVKPGEVLLMSSQVDPLMNFALALKLDVPA